MLIGLIDDEEEVRNTGGDVLVYQLQSHVQIV